MKQVLSILFIFSMVSCGNKNQGIQNTPPIDFNKIPLVEFFDSEPLLSHLSDPEFFVIPEKSVLISNIEKLLVTTDEFIIWDRFKNSGKIVIVNRRNLNTTVIDKMGKGPGEYSAIRDIAVNDNGEVLILDFPDHKILYYSKSGAFKRSIKIQKACFEMECMNDNICMFSNAYSESGNDNYYLFLQKPSLEVKQAMPFDSKKSMTLSGNNYLSSGGKDNVAFLKPFSDTIFALADDFKAMPEFTFDFGGAALPVNFDRQPESLNQVADRVAFVWNNFMWSRDLIYFEAFNKRKIESVFYNPGSKVGFRVNIPSLAQKVELGFPITITGSDVYFSISPDELPALKDNFQKIPLFKGKQAQLDKISSLTLNANPVILKIRLNL